MKFYLDENFPPGILGTIQLIYSDHEFRSWQDEGLEGVLDLDLFAILSQRSFDAIVTRDRRQLTDAAERKGLLDSSLAWIGLRDVRLTGREKLATTSASLIAGLGHMMKHRPEQPTAYLIYNVPHAASQRIKAFPLMR